MLPEENSNYQFHEAINSMTRNKDLLVRYADAIVVQMGVTNHVAVVVIVIIIVIIISELKAHS